MYINSCWKGLNIPGLFFDIPLFDVFDRLFLVGLLLWYLGGVSHPTQSISKQDLNTHYGFSQAQSIKKSCRLIFGQRVCCFDILVVSSVQPSRTPGWSKRGDQTWLSGREEGGRKGYKIQNSQLSSQAALSHISLVTTKRSKESKCPPWHPHSPPNHYHHQEQRSVNTIAITGTMITHTVSGGGGGGATWGNAIIGFLSAW